MLHAVIMAGGAGTRFWPASRVDRPKQLLDLAGDRSMLQGTVDRLAGLIAPARVMIVTNQRLVEPISEQLPEVPRTSIVGEPCKRDTAPCVGLSAALLHRHDPDATMVVMPADHVIGPDNLFRDAIGYAADLVEQQPSRIVTFGIKPNYAAESFGYVEREGESLASAGQPATFKVNRFREKPDAKTAQEYLDTGSFYWNSGIFVWKAKTILDALEEYEPAMFAHLQTIKAAVGQPNFQDTLQREFGAIQGKSIDYAVMEHYDDVLVVESPFSWDDVGNWPALSRLKGKDEKGNTLVGKHLGVNTTNTIVRGDDEHLIVTVGMDDCIIVRTPDATLIADRKNEESIRKVVELLTEKGWTEYL